MNDITLAQDSVMLAPLKGKKHLKYMGINRNKVRQNSNAANEIIFDIWLEKTKLLFLQNSESCSYEERAEQLQKIRNDVAWWTKNKGVISAPGISLLRLMPYGNLPKIVKCNPDLYEEWCSIWLDEGWLKDSELLQTILVESVLADNTSIVEKIIKDYGADINQSISGSITPTLGNRYFDTDVHEIKLGFFVKSEKMAKTLSSLGFDWGVELCENTPISIVIQNKSSYEFESDLERGKIIKLIDDFNIKKKKSAPVTAIIAGLEGAKLKEDIDILLRGLHIEAIRGKDGENFMHMISRYAPKFMYSYLSTKMGAKLTRMSDNNGRYPLEYFLCFCNRDIAKVNTTDMAKDIEKMGLPKPDWLEVKTMIVEYRMSHSGVDIVPLDIWKQQGPNSFRKCLKTERGQNFIKLAFEEAIAKEGKPLSGGSGGLEINRYTDLPNEKYSFFKLAKNKNEIQLALIQSWRCVLYYMYSNKSGDIKSIKDSVSMLIDKATESDIDIGEIKRSVVETNQTHTFNNEFDAFMSQNFSNWKNLAEITEKRRLMKVVSKKNTRTTKQICNAL